MRKTTTWKGIEVFNDFVWKIPNSEQPKKDDVPELKKESNPEGDENCCDNEEMSKTEPEQPKKDDVPESKKESNPEGDENCCDNEEMNKTEPEQPKKDDVPELKKESNPEGDENCCDDEEMNKTEPEQPKKDDVPESKKSNPEIDLKSCTDEEIEEYINKWKEDSKKYVEDQFSVLRQKLQKTLDKIADIVTTGESWESDSAYEESLVEPTEEVDRKALAALRRRPKARPREKPHSRIVFEKQLEDVPKIKSAFVGTALKSAGEARKTMESVSCKPREVENPSRSMTDGKAEGPLISKSLPTGEVGNPSMPASLTTGEVENLSMPETLTTGEVENPSMPESLTTGEVENPSIPESLTTGEIENPSMPATLTTGEVENSLMPASLTTGKVENTSMPESLTTGEVENPSMPESLTTGEVENPSMPATLTTGEVENPEESTSAERIEQTEVESSRSVNQTIYYLINRLTSFENPADVFKNVDSEELRVQLENFVLALGKYTEKLGGLQQSLEEKVLDTFEKNQTIMEFFARDALLVKGHHVPRSREQIQSQFDVLMKLVKEYIQPLKCNYDVILDDVVCCLETKNKILDMVEEFFNLDLSEKVD